MYKSELFVFFLFFNCLFSIGHWGGVACIHNKRELAELLFYWIIV